VNEVFCASLCGVAWQRENLKRQPGDAIRDEIDSRELPNGDILGLTDWCVDRWTSSGIVAFWGG
jgi:hypothetical protein